MNTLQHTLLSYHHNIHQIYDVHPKIEITMSTIFDLPKQIKSFITPFHSYFMVNGFETIDTIIPDELGPKYTYKLT